MMSQTQQDPCNEMLNYLSHFTPVYAVHHQILAWLHKRQPPFPSYPSDISKLSLV